MNRNARARRLARRYLTKVKVGGRIDLERLKREQQLGDQSIQETIQREELRRGLRTREDELAEKALKGDLKAYEELVWPWGPQSENKERAIQKVENESDYFLQLMGDTFVKWVGSTVTQVLRIKPRVRRSGADAFVSFPINLFRWGKFTPEYVSNYMIEIMPEYSGAVPYGEWRDAVDRLQRSIKVTMNFEFLADNRGGSAVFRAHFDPTGVMSVDDRAALIQALNDLIWTQRQDPYITASGGPQGIYKALSEKFVSPFAHVGAVNVKGLAKNGRRGSILAALREPFLDVLRLDLY